MTLVVDRRQAVHVRLAPRVAPFIGRTNPATGLPYTRADVAAELGCGVDVLYLAWRFAETGVAREGPGKGLGRGPRRARRVSSWWVARRPGATERRGGARLARRDLTAVPARRTGHGSAGGRRTAARPFLGRE